MGQGQYTNTTSSSYNQPNSYQRTGTTQNMNNSINKVLKSYKSKEMGSVPSMSRSTTMIDQKPKFKYNITTQNLISTFKTFAIDGDYLNKEAFNNSIESLFRFPSFPEMQFTYLSDKIYEQLDDSGDGKIQEDEFIQGFKNVLSSKDFRIKLTMMAMMNLPDKNKKYIEPNEIKEYFFKSWVQGYKYLGQLIEKDKNDFQSRRLPVANGKQMEIWALRYENQIKMAVEADLRENGIDPNMNIDEEQFKKWVYLDHTLYITYAHKTIMKATTLVKLDEVGFEDDQPQGGQGQGGSSMMSAFLNNNNNNNSNNNNNGNQPNYYPSF